MFSERIEDIFRLRLLEIDLISDRNKTKSGLIGIKISQTLYNKFEKQMINPELKTYTNLNRGC